MGPRILNIATRRMNLSDLPKMVLIAQQSAEIQSRRCRYTVPPITEQRFRLFLAKEARYEPFTLLVGGNIAGFMVFDFHQYEILCLAIARRCQNKNLGTTFIRWFCTTFVDRSIIAKVRLRDWRLAEWFCKPGEGKRNFRVRRIIKDHFKLPLGEEDATPLTDDALELEYGGRLDLSRGGMPTNRLIGKWT